MGVFIATALIGVIAGLRTFTAPTAVAWAAYLGVIPVAGTNLGFLAEIWPAAILTALAIAEFVGDKLPRTPSRKTPAAFIARLVSGAASGAVLGLAAEAWIIGLVLGVAGAVVGTLGGYAARMRLAETIGRDGPAALTEDAVAIAGAVLAVVLVTLSTV
ncbi:DUF4126 domain-containing protein [Bauldia sp.]|uniref:DUF4126 domain-containing protein n=1 Tax=Bauldia sp. TaxID=2575872 RepID=UPI003BA96341